MAGKMKRFTNQNHNVHPGAKPTYRIPSERFGEFSIKSQGMFTAMFGDVVDKLGRYEDIGTPEEFAQLKRLRK